MNIKDRVKGLPETSGVYLMKDPLDHIIYIGKSKNLKNRVRQYFYKSKQHTPKIIEMIGAVATFDHIITATELEALLLEADLIKKYKPRYNRLLKNTKGYPYIKITLDEIYPRIMIVTEKREDRALYFGPYTSLTSVERTVTLIRDKFLIRNCTNPYMANQQTGCLYFNLGTCIGPCRDIVTKDIYMKQVNGVIAFLNGKELGFIKDIEGAMKVAAKNLDFDKAARHRDDLSALQHILNTQRTINRIQKSRNILAIEPFNQGQMKIFLIRGSHLLYEEIITLEEHTHQGLMTYLRDQIKRRFKKEPMKSNKDIFQDDLDQAQIIYNYLRRKRNNLCHIGIPSTWLKEDNTTKLDGGIHRLLSQVNIY